MSLTREDLDTTTAVVRRHFPATPQIAWLLLGLDVGAQVWVKHENQTPTGAFKLRGGLGYTDRAVRANARRSGRRLAPPAATTARASRTPTRAAGLRVRHRDAGGQQSLTTTPPCERLGTELIVHGRDFQDVARHAIGERRGAGAARRCRRSTPSRGRCHDLRPGSVRRRRRARHGVGAGRHGLWHWPASPTRDLLGLTPRRRRGQRPGTGDCSVVPGRSGRRHRLGGDVRRRRGLPVTDPGGRGPDRRRCHPPRRVSDDAVPEAMRVMLRTTHQLPEPSGAIARAALLEEPDEVAGRRVVTVLTGCTATPRSSRRSWRGARRIRLSPRRGRPRGIHPPRR